MAIGILGPLEVSTNGTPIAVRGGKRRLLLTMLAVGAGRTVSIGRLVDALWGEAQTDASAPTLQTYVYQLRKVLGVDAVATGPQGYALGWPPDSVDAHRFEALLREAHASTHSVGARRERLVAALGLWRGPAFAEFPDVAFLASEAVRLDELRMRAIEDRVEADLALGDHGPLVAELEQLVAEHPLRERFWGQLMLALYRGGRQADALRAFERLQTNLREQLGLDPSPALVRLERQILAQEGALDAPEAPRSIPAGTAQSPLAPAASATQPIAFLFTDVEGSTRRWERAPDAMDPALAQHDAILRSGIAEFGGEVLTTAGDSFVACFTAATGAADAVAATLAIQLALQEVEWTGVDGLAVRMGVHIGPAFARDGTYFGPTLNRGARLHAVGHGGQVLVSAATAAAVGEHVPADAAFVDLGLHRLRDLGRPERVHQLTHPKLRATFPPLKADPATQETQATPLVGRAGEIERLGGRLRRITAGAAGGVSMISGEPGIGKTRIASAVAATARREGVRVLWGRCLEGTWALPFGPFAEAITDLLHQEGEATIDALGTRRRVIARLLPELAAEALPADDLDANEQRTQIFVAVAGLFGELADQGPLLVVLDDLHWADRATAALLRFVAREIADRPVLLVGTYRDSEVTSRHVLAEVLASLPRETDYERIPLGGLGTDDVALLARAVVGEEVPSQLVESVAADTDGNAFFVQQVLQQLAADRAGGDDSFDMYAVPATVLDVVDHRVVRLPEVAQQFLRAASVFEGDFDFDVVASVGEMSEDDALDGLDAVLDSRLLAPTDRADAYRFTHALVRQALMTGLSPSRVMRLHRRAAIALEDAARTTPAGLDAGRAAEIATYYLRSASLPGAERGVEPALVAADHAEQAGAFDEAAAHVRVALELLPAGDDRRAELLGRLGCSLARAAHGEDAIATMDEAVDLIAAAHGPHRAAEYALEANEALKAGLSVADTGLIDKGLDYIGDCRDEIWAGLYVWSIDQIEARPGYLEARLTDDFIRASKMVVEGRRLNIMIALPAACRNRDDVLRIPSWPSAHVYLAGELREPLAALDVESELAWRDGRVHWWAQTRAYAAWCHTALGDLDEARRVLDATVAVRLPPSPGSESEVRLLMGAYFLASAWDDNWGYLDAFADKYSDRLEGAQAVIQGYGSGDDATLSGGLMTVGAAKILARTGASEAAVQQLGTVVPEIEDIIAGFAPFFDLPIVHDFVEGLWYANAPEHLDVAEAAVRVLLEPDFRHPMTEARLSMARLAALRGETSAATKWFAEAREVLDDTGARTVRAITDFDEALVHVRLGSAGDEKVVRTRLAAAREEFEAIGMPGWLRRADALR